MKSTVSLSGLLFFACIVSAAEPNMYHDGWNDLNKNGKQDDYENPALPVEKRVADLLSQMTSAEKIGQLHQTARAADEVKQFAGSLRQGDIGSFLSGAEYIETPMQRNELQHIAVEQSRLGIPLIFGYDSIHGFRTVFPIPLAMASAWEPDLFERTQTVSARETAAVGFDWTFAPMVDLARDPRWGRIAEGFGEDPWLGSLYAAANVRGFQGTNVAAPDRVVACMKHFVGYGATEGGRDYNTTEISEYTLRNFYLPQFKAGVDAGAWTFMSAFNLLPPWPASGNHHTLTEILRNEWKFPGAVVSDYTAVEELIAHGVAADPQEAARLALRAGVDMEMVSSNYFTLPEQVAGDQIPQAMIDEAVRRVLTVKFAKGLFDKPYVNESLYRTAFLNADALALAREAAAKSCVLLVNRSGDAPGYAPKKDARALLPLSKAMKKILLIGPVATNADEMLGSWAGRGRAADAVSLASGIRAKLSADSQLTVLPGCGFHPGKDEDAAQIKQAVAAVKNASVVILALGEPRAWSGESQSRTDLNVTGQQAELFDAVNRAAAKARVPVVVVLFNGRPLTLPHIAASAGAVLEAWQPGVQGGNGVADILFGEAEPTGRLPVNFPYNVGQVPFYYNHYNTGRPGVGEYKGNYVDVVTAPLFPFGYGLGYTTFTYGKVELVNNKLKRGGTLTAQVKVNNTGTRAGTETVQLYLRDIAATAGPRPVRELKGFQKVQLAPGESRVVEFKISEHELGYFDSAGHWLVEPGQFELWLAKDSSAGEPVEFELEK
ncbi:MAG: beta-glucosidase [Verrucomicrobiota bacterium]